MSSFQSPLISAYLNLFNSIALNIAYLNNLSSFFINYWFNTLFKKKFLEIIGLEIPESNVTSQKTNNKSGTITVSMKTMARNNLVNHTKDIEVKSRFENQN